MRTIGLIGGTSWLSTIEYYRVINQAVHDQLGGMNSAKILLYSVNHEEFKPGDTTDWAAMAEKMSAIARNLERAGADCILLCANTMHNMAEEVQAAISIPLLHVADETAACIHSMKLKKVGLLGTRMTMELPFYKERLLSHGIEPLVPDQADRDLIHHSIFTELSRGIFTQQTKEKYIRILHKLTEKGAEGIILGCTEIPLLISQEDYPAPLFDTTTIHARAAVEFALAHP